jgi:hypothetical protein
MWLDKDLKHWQERKGNTEAMLNEALATVRRLQHELIECADAVKMFEELKQFISVKEQPK